MRVKDICGNKRNVNPADIQLHYEKVRGLTFWKSNLRLVLTDEQKELIKNTNPEVEFFNGFRTKFVHLSDIQ